VGKVRDPMARKKDSAFGKKMILFLAAFAFAFIVSWHFYLDRVSAKAEAIGLVQSQHLPKEKTDEFISKVHEGGKFKLMGWGIEETDEKNVFIVSYTARRLNEDGFKVGDPIGYWFKVDPAEGICVPLKPEGTVAPD
jgi:hypothetical protein